VARFARRSHRKIQRNNEENLHTKAPRTRRAQSKIIKRRLTTENTEYTEIGCDRCKYVRRALSV